jgi:drug/metabolite transporter (DMT)-like permease
MLWLVLSFVCSFGFGQLFKWSQRRGYHAPTVVSVNYLTLASAAGLYHIFFGQTPLNPAAGRIGLYTGIAFIVSMLVMTRALERVEVGAVLTGFRLAILVPVGFGLYLWGETIGFRQGAGLAMAGSALLLMTWRNGVGRRFGVALWWVLAVFFFQGLSQVFLRAVHYLGLDGFHQSFLLATAFTAGMLGSLFVLGCRRWPRPKELAMGIGIGLYNLLALTVILIALAKVPGTVYFPAHGCAVVILDNLAAHFFWREPLSKAALWGAILGAVAMILVL